MVREMGRIAGVESLCTLEPDSMVEGTVLSRDYTRTKFVVS